MDAGPTTLPLLKRPMLLGVAIALPAFLIYLPVRHNAFLRFDDYQYVTHNPHVTSGLTLANAKWAFSTSYEANWHPVTWLSHMLDCQLFGLNPQAHHLVNAGLHAANAFLLFVLLFAATRAIWRSGLVAALFAVHPLNVETVAWLAERKSLLCMFFSLLTLAAYGWYTRCPNWKRYLLIVAAFSLALMSKPMAVTLPFVLLLFDYWPLGRCEKILDLRRWAQLFAEKLPLFVMTAASCAVTVVAQRSGGAIASLPLPIRLENALTSYVFYLGKTFWPRNLSVFYPHPESALPTPDVIAAAFILLAITGAVLYLRDKKYLVVGWFLFLGTLVPVIGIVQAGHQSMSDRYAYLPCIGLFLMVTWWLGELPWQKGTALALCLVIAALAMATRNYLQYWQNGTKLFTRARDVAGAPDWMIEEALADSLLDEGHLRDAFSHYQEACAQRPNFAYCHYNLAALLLADNQLENALKECHLARRLAPANDATLLIAVSIKTSQVLLALGDLTAAEIELSNALRMDPANPTAIALQKQIAQRLGN